MKKWLILILFLVRVKVPFGVDVTYKHVKACAPSPSGYYELILSDDRRALVPIMWTVVEDEKDDEEK